MKNRLEEMVSDLSLEQLKEINLRISCLKLAEGLLEAGLRLNETFHLEQETSPPSGQRQPCRHTAAPEK